MFDYSILEVVRLCGLETVGSPSRKGEQKVKCPFVSGKTFDVNAQAVPETEKAEFWHCIECFTLNAKPIRMPRSKFIQLFTVT